MNFFHLIYQLLIYLYFLQKSLDFFKWIYQKKIIWIFLEWINPANPVWTQQKISCSYYSINFQNICHIFVTFPLIQFFKTYIFQQNVVSVTPASVVTTEQKATPNVTNYYPPKSSVHSANGNYRGVRESSYQNPGPHGNLRSYFNYALYMCYVISVCFPFNVSL